MYEPPDLRRSSSVSSVAGSLETIRWRPWPCGKCRQSGSRASFLAGRIRSSAQVRPAISDIDQTIIEEIGWLREWVNLCPHTSESSLRLPWITTGSEHFVYYNKPETEVIKVTIPNCFGESYFISDGKMSQRNCGPIEYLVRLNLCRTVFGFKTKTLGISDAGQIISTQQYVTGNPPTQDQANEFLLNNGFEPVKKQYWLWKTIGDDVDIWIGDARSDNFVLGSSGIVPIDLRMWIEKTAGY